MRLRTQLELLPRACAWFNIAPLLKSFFQLNSLNLNDLQNILPYLPNIFGKGWQAAVHLLSQAAEPRRGGSGTETWCYIEFGMFAYR